MEYNIYYSHDIQVDEKNNIIYGFSSAFEPPKEEDILLRENGGYLFRLFQDGEENPALANDYGVYLYTYSNGEVVPISKEEIERQTQEIIQKQQEELKNQEAQKEKEKSLMNQVETAMSFAIASNTSISDDQAMEIPDLFPIWPNGTDQNGYYVQGQIVKDETNNVLYRIVPEQVKPLDNQPPHAEGMLAVYRPIEESYKGTEDDPIPWVYGMDCYEGQYYSYEGHVYKVAVGGTMTPCIWEPGTPGLWQWELIK